MNEKDRIKPLNRKDAPASKGSAKGDKNGGRKKAPAGRHLAWVTQERLKWIILVFLSIIFAVFLFPNILTQGPNYRIGDVAETSIKASHDFLLENHEQTQINREEESKRALAVYDFDRTSSDLVSRVKEAFDFARERVAEWGFREEPAYAVPGTVVRPELSREEFHSFRDRFFAILNASPETALFQRLLEEGFSSGIEQTVIPLVSRVLGRGIVDNQDRLMSQADKGGVILHDLYTQKETLVDNLDRFYDYESATSYIYNQAEAVEGKLGNTEAARATLDLGVILLQPNVTFNQRESELRKEAARKDVKPTYFKIKKGEMLVREGERIGPEHLEKLAGEFRTRDRMDLLGRIPAMAVLIALFFAVMYVVAVRGIKVVREDRRDLLFNAVTLLGLFVFAWAYRFVADEIARGFPFLSSRTLLYAMPVACGGMLLSVFQGLPAATAFSLIVSVLASLICGGQVALFLYFFLGSLVAAFGVRRCTERGTLIKAGLKVGLMNVFLALSIEMIYGSLYSAEVVIAMGAGFAGGILTAIITTGSVSYTHLRAHET